MTLHIDTTNRDELLVSLCDNAHQVASIKLPTTLGSEDIVPAMAALFKKANRKLTGLAEVTVNPGPGSYTGIRVGVAVGQALGYCLDIPVNGKHLPNEIIEPVYA